MCLIAATAWAKPALVEAGAVEGVAKDGLAVDMGIPFAAPRVGELRWREPQPVAPWEGTRRATSFAPACMQKGVSMPGEKPPVTSEDRLYLNVWTPAKAADERLPVIATLLLASLRDTLAKNASEKGVWLDAREWIVTAERH